MKPNTQSLDRILESAVIPRFISSEVCFAEKESKRLKTMGAYQSFEGIQHADV